MQLLKPTEDFLNVQCFYKYCEKCNCYVFSFVLLHGVEHPEHGDFGAYGTVDVWARGCELGHRRPRALTATLLGKNAMHEHNAVAIFRVIDPLRISVCGFVFMASEI